MHVSSNFGHYIISAPETDIGFAYVIVRARKAGLIRPRHHVRRHESTGLIAPGAALIGGFVGGIIGACN
jgi:hypothetical protein